MMMMVLHNVQMTTMMVTDGDSGHIVLVMKLRKKELPTGHIYSICRSKDGSERAGDNGNSCM